MGRMYSELESACRKSLLDCMPDGLKSVLQEELDKGFTAAQVLGAFRVMLVRLGKKPRCLTGLMVEEFLNCDAEGNPPHTVQVDDLIEEGQ